MLENNSTTSSRWFVATDYQPYKTYIKTNIPSNIEVLNPSIPTDGMYQCSDVQQALVDLWSLSKCQQLILTSWSSFGWMASGLSGKHPMIVANSKKCYQQTHSRPCYYELTHLKQLSCFHSSQMLNNEDEQCCQSGFCSRDYAFSSAYAGDTAIILDAQPFSDKVEKNVE
ncbi:unnamed protein product, partial [Didymodactylos carnosus]